MTEQAWSTEPCKMKEMIAGGQTQNGTGADNKEQIKTTDNAGIRKNGVNSQHTYLG